MINKGWVKPGSALDLGCGVGAKAIYLAKKGFKTTGVDISATAIKHAKEKAKKAKVDVKFINTDSTDLSFLGNKKFDFILDWANLHGIDENKRRQYISEIIKHTKPTTKLLLRCFSKKDMTREASRRKMAKVHLFSKDDIENLYGDSFEILKTNKSKPFTSKKKAPAKWLDEYLMEKS